MSSQEILGYVRAEPFRSFRLHMASGRTFEVRHPEMVRVGTTSAVVFDYAGNDDGLYERIELLGLLPIKAIEMLDR